MLGGNQNVSFTNLEEDEEEREETRKRLPEQVEEKEDDQPQKQQKTEEKEKEKDWQPVWLQELEKKAQDIVWDGLGPLHLALGAIESAINGDDVRRHYRWRDGQNTFQGRANPVVTGAETLAEFYRLNRHLGDRFLKTLVAVHLPQEKKEKEEEEEEGGSEDTEEALSGVRIEPAGDYMPMQMLIGVGTCHVVRMGTAAELDELKRLQGPNHTYVNILTPSWVWAVLPTAAFRFLLQSTTIGALEMVASELGRLSQFRGIPRDELLYDLISSDDVRDIFCEFVGQRINKSSGGNAYQKNSSSMGKGFMFSAGFKTRNTNTNWRRGALLWFEHNVYYAPGPTPDNRLALIQSQFNHVVSVLRPDAEKRTIDLLQKYRMKIRELNMPVVADRREGNHLVTPMTADDRQRHPELAGMYRGVLNAIQVEKDLLEQIGYLDTKMVAMRFELECIPRRVLRVK